MISEGIVHQAEYIASILSVLRIMKGCGGVPVGIRLISR